MHVKLQIARAQLGTALDLFIRDKDPYSVHALACGGAEIMDGLAKEADLPSTSTHILSTIPDIDQRRLKRVQNQYWNAFKHFYQQDGKTVRDDEALVSDFSDAANDAVLFCGWLDYLLVTRRLPVEVQVFQVWWYATNPRSMRSDVDPSPWQAVFPQISSVPRSEQKRRLRRAVEKWRRNAAILVDPRTERGSLCPRL